MTALVKKGLKAVAVVVALIPASLMFIAACIVWWKIVVFVWSA